MKKLIIQGPAKLEGTVKISGSKNAALPIIAATLLTNQTVELFNVPEITDTKLMLSALEELGAKVTKLSPNNYQITTATVSKPALAEKTGNRLRASILFSGALLGRVGKFDLPYPGGCLIGKRSIDTHLDAFRKLGVNISQDKKSFSGLFENKIEGEKTVKLAEKSVTATENIMMAAVLGTGKVIVKNAACEPHIQDLAKFLNSLGAKISGAKTGEITIEQVQSLSGGKHRVVSDEIETGTYAVMAAITGSKIQIINIPPNITPIAKILEEMGVTINKIADDAIEVSAEKLSPAYLKVDVWPGIPTDMQPALTVLATQAQGQSSVYDWMFENRLKYTEGLNKMGAKITIKNPHYAEIDGPTPLHGETIISPDLRAGITFVIAALSAEGETVVENAELIERGYENLVDKLRGLGANISKNDTQTGN